jgi:hypothetical protein
MKIKNEKPTRALPFGFSNENTSVLKRPTQAAEKYKEGIY